MTEYLILSLSRAVPLVWEYNREITFNLTFTRNYVNIPKSTLARVAEIVGGSGPTIDSTSKRIFRAFGTPPPPTVSGVRSVSKPRLHKIAITLIDRIGNPQFMIDLHYANPNGTPGQYITSFTPVVVDEGYGNRSLYVDLGNPPSAFSAGYELDWNTLYSIVFRPVTANASNKATTYIVPPGGDPLVMSRIGYSTDSGATWTLWDGREWYSSRFNSTTIAYAFYYESTDAIIPVAKSSEAFRSYFNGWVSRTSLPTGFTILQESINSVSNLTTGAEIPLTDSYSHALRFYTTANVSGFTQTDVASFKWRYDINPVTVDMFYASEAYLQSIEFLDTTTTNAVRLNDSYEQEFRGAGGTSVTFDPPVLWWKAQVLSGRVRLKALVFE